MHRPATTIAVIHSNISLLLLVVFLYLQIYTAIFLNDNLVQRYEIHIACLCVKPFNFYSFVNRDILSHKLI